jgi:hypothetical protein
MFEEKVMERILKKETEKRMKMRFCDVMMDFLEFWMNESYLVVHENEEALRDNLGDHVVKIEDLGLGIDKERKVNVLFHLPSHKRMRRQNLSLQFDVTLSLKKKFFFFKFNILI